MSVYVEVLESATIHNDDEYSFGNENNVKEKFRLCIKCLHLAKDQKLLTTTNVQSKRPVQKD